MLCDCGVCLPTKKLKQKHAYQLLVVLEGSEPKIWRQISVPGNMTLADLDRIDPQGFDVNSANRDVRRWLLKAE